MARNVPERGYTRRGRTRETRVPRSGAIATERSRRSRNAPAVEETPAAALPPPTTEHFVVISGLSGAGKSQASKLFEDAGYSCVDNLPPELLDGYLTLRRTEPDRDRRAALVLDIRAGDPAPAIERAAAELRAQGTRLELVYLEATDASLVSRFSETRHRHPLEMGRGGVQAGIAEERRRLARTRELADHLIDTTGLSIGQLKERLLSIVPLEGRAQTLEIGIVTFGYKYGMPLDADLVFDVRFLTNPYWQPELKPLSGLEAAVREFVLDQPAAKRFLDLVVELVKLTAPAYRTEGKEQLRIALGCTGGYHRSIVLGEELAARLAQVPDASVSTFHRELKA
jgi:RNase adapter protein RapZ